MYFRNASSINLLSDREACMRLYYFYHFLKTVNIVHIDYDAFKLFFSYAKRLNRSKRLEEILQGHIITLVSQDKLHLVDKEEEENVWAFPNLRNGKYSFRFYEDEDAYSRFNYGPIECEANANLYRCAFCGGQEALLRVFEQVFFSDTADSDSGQIEIPSAIQKGVFTVDIMKFLFNAKVISKSQALCLQHLYRASMTKEFEMAFCCLSDVTNLDFLRSMDISAADLTDFLENRNTGVLRSFLDEDLAITPELKSCVIANSLQPFFNDVSRKMDVSNAFPIQSFSVSEESVNIAKSLLRGADKTHILLYGACGSGKTEFAKALAKECGLKAIRFKNSYETESDSSAAISALNVLLSVHKKDTVFIIDEAESLLETRPAFGLFGASCRKGPVNKLFELSQNKVIWILNYTDLMDVSTKRRFTYSIAFSQMSKEKIEQITRQKLNEFQIAPALKKKILDLCHSYDVTGASVENIASVMKSLDSRDEKLVENAARNVLESNSSLLYGQSKMREKTNSNYDISVLNASVAPEEIVEMVQNAQKFEEESNVPREGIRMLFYGASGTGKTELARHIAQKLGKKILLKRPSDIISKGVGDTEKNISDAFCEAEMSGQILLFDEADSFFRDREQAQCEWEITKTNEFLTQMEEFKGILICTTNLRSIMDKAILRRFHICSEFKPLDKTGIKTLLAKYFPSLKFTGAQIDSLASRSTVTPGDFGSLFGKVRFMKKESINAALIIKELLAIQDEKSCGCSRRIGFFSA